MQDDQPRPDLDAAIEAVLPSLVAVTDEAHAASLRRTRPALAGAAPARDGLGSWRWGVAAAAAVLVALALWVSLGHGPAPQPGSVVERRPASPAVVETAPARSAPLVAPVPVAPERVASAAATPRPSAQRRSVPVQAASAIPTTPKSSRPDPLIALARAVQEIPDDAWTAGLARARAPLAIPDVHLEPIVIAPIETPPILDAPAGPLAPGEP
jgi:hypothetical protein